MLAFMMDRAMSSATGRGETHRRTSAHAMTRFPQSGRFKVQMKRSATRERFHGIPTVPQAML